MFMKRRSSFLWVAFAAGIAFTACAPSSESSQVPRSALVKVECRDASARQILELLRSSKGKDISMRADGFCTEITAAFSPADTPAWKLQQTLHDLNNLYGVMHVEIMENPRPILQNF